MIYGGSNVVLDHISVSWATDENIGSYFSAKNITWSNSLTSEALYDSNHEDDPSGNPGVTEPHSMGTLWAYVGQLSIHHTMFARNVGRNPQVTFLLLYCSYYSHQTFIDCRDFRYYWPSLQLHWSSDQHAAVGDAQQSAIAMHAGQRCGQVSTVVESVLVVPQ